MIAILVLKYFKARAKVGWSLSNLVAMLRFNLLTYRDLLEWLNDLYFSPPEPPQVEQLSFLT